MFSCESIWHRPRAIFDTADLDPTLAIQTCHWFLARRAGVRQWFRQYPWLMSKTEAPCLKSKKGIGLRVWLSRQKRAGRTNWQRLNALLTPFPLPPPGG